MDEINTKLFRFMELAEEQQKAVSTALAGLEKSKTDLTKAATALQEYGKQLAPNVAKAASESAAQAVKTALENASQTATDAVAKSCKPLLDGLAGVEKQAAAIESKLAGVAKWFGWRFAATACGAVLMVIVAAWGVTWWQRSQLADLKTERDQINAEVAAAQNTLAVLDKHLGGARYVEAPDGQFIRAPGGVLMTCIGKVPCIKLKSN